MRKCLVLLMVALLVSGLLCAQAEPSDPFPQVRRELAEAGITMDDATYEAAVASYQEFLRRYGALGFGEYYATPGYFAYSLLLYEGAGSFDEETWAFTPTSDQVYALDAEVFNIGEMYTEFLRGVQAIVDDAVFDNVREALSGVDAYSMGGHRDVGFTCNGNPYAVRLDSYGDWLNPEIIGFVNDALQKEGCRGQLHPVSDSFDQMVILIYGDAERAAALRAILGTEPWDDGPEEAPGSLLDWLY